MTHDRARSRVLTFVASRSRRVPEAPPAQIGRLSRASLWSAAAALTVSLTACTGCRRTTDTHTGAATTTAASSGETTGTSATRAATYASFDLFALGRGRGSIAPCGCTSDPLGGLQYLFGAIDAESNEGARLVLEPGSLLFPDVASPERPSDEAGWAQADRRATVLHTRFAALGDAFVGAVGPSDVDSPRGVAALQQLKLPRVLSNAAPATDGATLAPGHLLRTLHSLDAELKVGVVAALDPSLAPATLNVTEPPPAIATQVTAARAAGAQLVVALLHAEPSTAREWLQALPAEAAPDLAVIGGPLPAAQGITGVAPRKVGNTWLVEPGEQLQTVTHVRLMLPRGVTTAPALAQFEVMPSAAERARELELEREKLTTLRDDPSADASFVHNVQARVQQLEATAGAAPEVTAPSLIVEQVPVSCRLPKDPAAATLLAGYDRGVAEDNQRRFKGVMTPEPAKGAAGYAGVGECEMCHSEAAQQWSSTIHARAYTTLERANKQFDLSCVGCHVTGFREPGGAEVVEHRGLTHVQCEQCHGPGSLHANDPTDSKGAPQHIVRAPDEAVCRGCHTPEHSDTFEFEAYLRDVLGEHHGAARRATLGDGATAHELRAQAQAKVGGSCAKGMH